MSYVIVTTILKRGRMTHLFMVDRHAQRKSFWSDRLQDVLLWQSESAAHRRLAQVRHNQPRVVDYAEAMRLECENHPHGRRPPVTGIPAPRMAAPCRKSEQQQRGALNGR